MTFTITTPLYYVNDKPHLGSTYTTIACDAIARFYRLENNEVLFITGVDEHGQKIQRTSESKNIDPKLHCDQISDFYLKSWENWSITNNSFIRTTSKRHQFLVNQFFHRVCNSGDIEIGRQKGWYCVGCEEFKETSEEENSPECPIHLRKLEWRDEENLFFRLSKYQKQIEDLIKNDNFIQPKSRRNEIIKFVESGLKDFSISRINVEWGIPVPGYPGHTFYVWFDALLGYLSGTLEKSKEVNLDKLPDFGWPASVHVIGKDILRFHAVYWPAMLLSAGVDLPLQVFGHGFLTREGQKMGKSIGNVLDPQKLLEVYGIDSIRWYLLRDIEFGQDGDFQNKRFVEIVNNDLSNTIGNLLNRTISMSKKWFGNTVPECTDHQDSEKFETMINESIDKYKMNFRIFNFKKATEEIMLLATKANVYLNEKEPWKTIKEDDSQAIVSSTLYNVLETTRIIGYLLKPITPDLSDRILYQLGINSHCDSWIDNLSWGKLDPKNKIPDPKPVMNRLEIIDEL
tara:strand:+ start:1070 stop:2611 length:1542 start_codon:yes stop_codon:yes gene_type:complete